MPTFLLVQNFASRWRQDGILETNADTGPEGR
jgi:hypothetical protein